LFCSARGNEFFFLVHMALNFLPFL
jgi:hypothetical protein